MSSRQRNDGEKDISDDALCVVFGVPFILLLLPVPIIDTLPGIIRQIRMNSEPSFSAARSSLETVHRLRTAVSCECHKKGLRQSGVVLHLPLTVSVEVDFQDALRIHAAEANPVSFHYP